MGLYSVAIQMIISFKYWYQYNIYQDHVQTRKQYTVLAVWSFVSVVSLFTSLNVAVWSNTTKWGLELDLHLIKYINLVILGIAVLVILSYGKKAIIEQDFLIQE